ncbi:peptidase domain-containing ABC transporter [Alteromonas sp. ASW11-130]|uniref:peptidase domain-containing ABC transporter n=1 Tax=Alteromonas sp. ASW11-130 TaxID=3015775 RepID=UPI0022420CC8|nr:peptidase domain-containing ABC transporter [Alteromonas sp. ASW11-130]MCW8091917.1 peptidase domain-containing ABC transporter [Alteromonas sp. ASW11-130]
MDSITSHSLAALSGKCSRRTPMVFQTEAAECGLACLAMVANYFGKNTDLHTLRRKFSISMRGASLKQIIEISSQLQLTTRPLKVEISHFQKLKAPCILHWDMHHFVVLTKVNRDGILINDPALGARKIRWREVDKHFTGIALELSPTAEFKGEATPTKLSLSHFWHQAQGLKRSLGILFLLSVMIQLFTLASPYYMQTVIDDALINQQQDLLLILALGFGLLLLIETGVSLFRQFLVLSLSSRLQLQMSANVFHHLIRLPVSYFSKRHVGDVVSRFTSLSQIREFFTVGLVTAVLDGVMALITLIVMFVYSSQLSFVVLAVATAYFITRACIVPAVKRLNAERILASANEQSHFMESVRGVQTVKQFSQESSREGQWQNKLTEVINADIHLGKWDISTNTINKLLFGIENIVIVYLAAHLVLDNAFTVGMLYAFMSYKNRFISSVDGLITKYVEFKMMSVHFDRLADIVFSEKEPMLTERAGIGDSKSACLAPLEVNAISYRYSDIDKPIFDNLSLTVEPGSIIAIVGPSGAGKSTLMRCLMGLEAPTSGKVLYRGQTVYSSAWFRKNTASVMQGDQCLSGTIADNITCFDEVADFERMMWCAQQACIHDEIMTMPMQYQTLVGDMGRSLSGGQLQRVLLARALYRNPSILFLDEASSHLDVVNEQRINKNLAKLSITRILVAHRPETIALAERVYVLNQGCLHLIDPDAELQNLKQQGEHDA